MHIVCVSVVVVVVSLKEIKLVAVSRLLVDELILIPFSAFFVLIRIFIHTMFLD